MRRASFFLLRSLGERGARSIVLPGHSCTPIAVFQAKLAFCTISQANRRCRSSATTLVARFQSRASSHAVPEPSEFVSGKDAILETFEALESAPNVDREKLAQASSQVVEHLYSTSSGNHEMSMRYALRALKVLQETERGSILVAKALIVLGSSSFKLNRFEDGLQSLETAEQILERLGNHGRAEYLSVCLSLQLKLAEAKMAMGRRKESLLNLRRSFELRRSIAGPDSLETASACKDLAEAYATVLDFQEALPLCCKASEIYEARLGNLSVEAAQARRLLAVIYSGLEENDEALVQNEICREVLKGLGMDADARDAEVEAAGIKITMGRLEEAIESLKGVIQVADKESETRASVYVAMAKALFSQEKFGESKRCLEIACSIFREKESAIPGKVASAYAEISMLYEAMTEFEIAMGLMNRTIAMLEEHPQEQHLQGSLLARLGWLFLLTGRTDKAVPCLESAIEKLKWSFGPKHFGLGFAYKHLGSAFLDKGNPQSAVEMLALAKNIIVATFGAKHEDYIDTCQCLANAYGSMGRYALALEFQQCVIEAWESHGPDAREELWEAYRLFEQLKKKSQGSASAVFPANSLPSSIGK